MPSDYPSGYDSFDDISPTDPLNNPSHSQRHDDQGDAVENIEAELGLNPSGSFASVVDRLDSMGGTGIPAGAIMQFGGAAAPDGWLLCDGTIYDRNDYLDLFAALGGAASPWGLPDSVTFKVPDLRQRFLVGKAVAGTGAAIGETGGNLLHTHPGPSHTHSGGTHTHTVDVPQFNVGASTTNQSDTTTGPPSGTTDNLSNITGSRDAAGAAHIHNYPHSHDISDNVNPAAFASGGASGATGASGTADSGSNTQVPPYATVHHIIKT